MKNFLYLLVFFFSLKGGFSFSSYFKSSDPGGSLLRSSTFGCTESLELSLRSLSSYPEKKKLLGKALIWAAKHKKIKALQILLRNKASVYFTGTKGETALHWVADRSVRGNEECYELLVSYGADPESQDHQGVFPGYIRMHSKPLKKACCSRFLLKAKRWFCLKKKKE